MGGAAGLKMQFESVLGGGVLEWQIRQAPELVPSGVPEVDRATGGLPRGCLTEIFGAASSGRTSLLVAILAEATAREEVCALVDAEDAFDPASAAAAGVRFDRLLWVRCGHRAEYALKAADLLIQGGGFGLVAMDLGDTPPEMARRISLTSWFRLRRAVEHTPTVLLTVARRSNAKTCASLMLECARERVEWGGPPGLPSCSTLLRGMRVHVARRKPGRAVAASFLCGRPEEADDEKRSSAPLPLPLARE
jgi:recombination protein RecA